MKVIRHPFLSLLAAFLLCCPSISFAEDNSQPSSATESAKTQEKQASIKASLVKLWKSTGNYGFLNGEAIKSQEP